MFGVSVYQHSISWGSRRRPRGESPGPAFSPGSRSRRCRGAGRAGQRPPLSPARTTLLIRARDLSGAGDPTLRARPCRRARPYFAHTTLQACAPLPPPESHLSHVIPADPAFVLCHAPVPHSRCALRASRASCAPRASRASRDPRATPGRHCARRTAGADRAGGEACGPAAAGLSGVVKGVTMRGPAEHRAPPRAWTHLARAQARAAFARTAPTTTTVSREALMAERGGKHSKHLYFPLSRRTPSRARRARRSSGHRRCCRG